MGLGSLWLVFGAARNCMTWRAMLGCARCSIRNYNGLKTLCTLGRLTAGHMTPRSDCIVAGPVSLRIIAGTLWNSHNWVTTFVVRPWVCSVGRSSCCLEVGTLGLSMVSVGLLPPWSIIGMSGLGALRLILGVAGILRRGEPLPVLQLMCNVKCFEMLLTLRFFNVSARLHPV